MYFADSVDYVVYDLGNNPENSVEADIVNISRWGRMISVKLQNQSATNKVIGEVNGEDMNVHENESNTKTLSVSL